MSQRPIINTLKYDEKLCTGCGMCVVVCPHGVFCLSNRKAKIIELSSCMECSACQLNCPANAIEVDSSFGLSATMIKAALLGKKEVSCGVKIRSQSRY